MSDQQPQGGMTRIGSYLRDTLQGASNAAASNVSAPVDGIAWALRKLGVPVPGNAVGGSDWMAQQGLTAEPQSKIAAALGEAFGGIAPAVAAAKAPQIARAMLKGGENLAAPSTMPMAGQRGAALVAPSSPTPEEQAARMAAVGYERGWFRGGPEIVNGKMSGPWYTRSADEAADYARRFGDAADVREYAIPKSGHLNLNMSYSSKLAQDLAGAVESSPQGARLAEMLRQYAPEDRVAGLEIWQGLKNNVGEDVGIDALQKLGFRGLKGVNSPDYVRLLPGTVARDAERAAFDPAKIKAHVDDIYGRATPAGMAALAGAAGAGLLAVRRNQASE